MDQQDSFSNPLSLMEELVAIAADLSRSTVEVRSRHPRHRSGVGSGVIWQADGIIITNAHVVTGTEADVELSDGQILSATVTARNVQRDLVALKVSATDLPAVSIGDAASLRVGELVLAIGHPLGVRGALTTGIIHSLGSARAARHWIQADIQLAPGNSGGPLATVQGQVVGINTMIVNGRGFAVPSHVVQTFLNQSSDHPYLGVSLQLVRVPLNRRRGFGLLITAIERDSPAAAAQLQLGDVFVGVKGQPFRQPDELWQILAHSQAGDGLSLNVLRGDQRLSVDVVLCNKPSAIQAA